MMKVPFFIIVSLFSFAAISWANQEGPQCGKSAQDIAFAMANTGLDRDLFDVKVDDVEVSDAERGIYDYYVIVKELEKGKGDGNTYEISLRAGNESCQALEAKLVVENQ